MKIRNIEIVWKHDNGTPFFVTTEYVDWYDWADFLKQEELAGRVVIFKAWRYVGKRV